MQLSEELKKILQEYRKQSSNLDELLAENGELHKHWEPLLRQILDLGEDELWGRNIELQRLLKDHGVTYNIYDRQDGLNNPWKLDPIPFLISVSSWNTLEKGIQQRALLLDLLFKDLYGPQKILKAGVLPPELIYSSRAFLRPCFGTLPNHPHNLLLYAADISRADSGQIQVIGDRTQAPSGWSYTLENRVAMARVLPEFFAHTKVRKISPYFQRIRENLIDFAPQDNYDPLIVLLTPGQWNETYFEHAYLSSLQGFTLVQGQDLMVKDGFVWLKTLSGLERVDIVLRHLDDNYCDPLSLKPDSQLGVAGFLEVVRRGQVTVANPPGSSILENPGLMAFMPQISRYFLGEELLLPNLKTWWCGRQEDRNFVLSNLKELVIKDLSRRPGGRTRFGWRLQDVELTQLKANIIARPHNFVAQQQAIVSTSPSFTKNYLEPRHTVLRCFASATHSGYEVMPGGLTRSASKMGTMMVSNQSGAFGKDTWVLTEKAINPIEYSPRIVLPRYSEKGMDELPSRMAENLFWVGRYIMRARITARYLRRILKHKTEIDNFGDPIDREVFDTLLVGLTHLTMTYPGFVGEKGQEKLKDPDEELKLVILDPERPGGLAHTIQMWTRAANMVRNHWSMDTWRIFDQIQTMWQDLSQEVPAGWRPIRNSLDALIVKVAASLGFTLGSLSVEEGRHVFDIGMDLERGMMIASLLRSTLTLKQDRFVEDSLLETVLLTTESLSTYRHRFRGRLQLESVLNLTLVDDTYEQSLAYLMGKLQRDLAVLPQTALIGNLRQDQKEILKAYTALQVCDSRKLVNVSEEENGFLRKDLDTLLAGIYNGLANSASAIMQTFFRHAGNEMQTPTFLYNTDF